MSFVDKLKNTVQKATGQAKEQIGRATGDRSLQVEGQRDQTSGDLKNAGEKLKDAFRRPKKTD